MLVRDVSTQVFVPFWMSVSLPAESFQCCHHCCLYIPSGKSQGSEKACIRGMEETRHRREWWQTVQDDIFKEDRKNTKSTEEKSSTPQAREFPSVTEIRAISQQLLLASRLWSNTIREVLLGILCFPPISPVSHFAQAHRRAELLGSCTACFVFTILPSDPFTNKAFSKHVFKQCLSFC